jgi:preprotein translocase subunit SecA
VSSALVQSLRPGIASGICPERAQQRDGWPERTAHSLQGILVRPVGPPRRAQRFVESVCAHSLDSASDEELSQQVKELRGRLVREELGDESTALAFALICEAAHRSLGTRPYDVQLLAGWAMVHGTLAEMETGEGKTLAVTLPAATAALAGIPVHLISANDYLVERDSAAMRPLYEQLGLSLGAVTDSMRDPAERRAAYACDITYATSSSIAFDYLRDGLERRGRKGRLALRLQHSAGEAPLSERLLLRGLCFAIVDEADSVLIDEARTPLILSGAPSAGDSEDWGQTYQSALQLARGLSEGSDFLLDRVARSVEFTSRGRARLETQASTLGSLFSGPKRREEWVGSALSALHLFDRERHYIVRGEKVEIVDQQTGRAMPDRSWERGLHQLIELKEGVPLTPERETQARISYQQFFRRYLRLAGATGTAREVSSELWRVYGLRTFVVPTRLPVKRRPIGTRVFATQEHKWAAVVHRIGQAQARRRPVLVGTGSVAASEELSRRLEEQGIPHRVLNARQDTHEASIVAEAGEAGRITVATHMAGRGTDIRLGEGVAESGGLHVIATQRGEARRIDRQLYGRSGRQGDPGSHEAILSLEDDPIRGRISEGLLRWLARGAGSGSSRLGKFLTSFVQRAEEARHARMRRRLIAHETDLADLLAFSGSGE